MKLIIGTRGSALALWQSRFVAKSIQMRCPEVADVELVTIKTSGDKLLDVPLAKIGGKGLFTKELEEALLNGHGPRRAIRARLGGAVVSHGLSGLRRRFERPLLFLREGMARPASTYGLPVDADVGPAVDAAQGHSVSHPVQQGKREALLAAHIVERIVTNEANVLHAVLLLLGHRFDALFEGFYVLGELLHRFQVPDQYFFQVAAARSARQSVVQPGQPRLTCETPEQHQ